MNIKERYKLEALLQRRQAAKQQRQEQLAHARRTELNTLEIASAARAALDEARAALAGLRNDHGAAQGLSGPLERKAQRERLTAAKLTARQQYISRRQAELEKLEHALQEAQQTVVEAKTKTDDAKRSLAISQAELEAIERDKQRWQQRQRVAKQRLEEAELDDVLASRREPGKRG